MSRMEEEKKVNHILHLILTILTAPFFCAWLVVWVFLILVTWGGNYDIRKRNQKRYEEEQEREEYNRKEILRAISSNRLSE